MSIWQHCFKRPAATDYHTHACLGEGEGAPVQLTYLGTAGFVLQGYERTLVLDPYLSRIPPWRLFTQPLRADAERLARYIPVADDVLVGHAHYDHVLDAPCLCQQTGARLIGSSATIMVGRAAGLPETQMLATSGDEDIACGSWRVRGLPSRHGRVFGRIPFPGDITAPPAWPPRLHTLRHGQVLNWSVQVAGLRILHIDSADYIDESLQGLRVDVLCLCAVGRQSRPSYTRTIIERVRPRWVIPCHWDTMMTPLESPPDLIPGVDLPGFLDEIRQAGAEPLLLPLLGRMQFRPLAGSASAG